MTWFECWELELGSGSHCSVDPVRYADALVVVLCGTLSVRTRGGHERAFGAGSLLAPCWAEVVDFANHGPDVVRLLGVARRTTIGRADD